MNPYGKSLHDLIRELSLLPGIGPKSAQRIAFHIINLPDEKVKNIANAMMFAKKNLHYCSVCCNLSDTDPCPICSSLKRDNSLLMIVEDPRDMAAYEKTNEYKGLYHILHGVISPLKGIDPSGLKIKELLKRLQTNTFKEIIIATNPNIEGEATALYLHKLLQGLEIPTSRIAHGVPVGGELEFVDEITLTKALEGRRLM